MLQQQAHSGLAHIVDTLRIVDTVRMVDTVRVGPPAALWSVGLSVVSILFGGGVVWKALERLGNRRLVRARISNEAWEARRELRAGFEHQRTEPPGNRTDLLIAWARHVHPGLDGIKKRFALLKEHTVSASGDDLRDKIHAASIELDQIAGALNKVFAQRGISIDKGTDDTLRPGYAKLRHVIDLLTELIDEKYRARDDGYNEP